MQVRLSTFMIEEGAIADSTHKIVASRRREQATHSRPQARTPSKLHLFVSSGIGHV